MAGAEVAVRKFAPVTLPDRIAFAKYLATAGMLPQQYRNSPGDILLAMEYGDSLGIPTVQAMSTINVIDGKPSASAALISALVRRAGHRLRVSGDDQHAVATIIRSDDPEYEYRSEWNLDRAVRAGLCTLDPATGRPRARAKSGKVLPWESYTSALLKARAITEVARDACQEALMGVQYTPEELGAVVDAEGAPVTAAPAEPHRVVDPETTAPPPADDPVDAEIVADPIPVTLPDDFDLMVENAENKLDLDDLANLATLAKESQNMIARATVTAAWKRVVAERKRLNLQPGEAAPAEVVDGEIVPDDQEVAS